MNFFIQNIEILNIKSDLKLILNRFECGLYNSKKRLF
jgi:hypothetical protein